MNPPLYFAIRHCPDVLFATCIVLLLIWLF